MEQKPNIFIKTGKHSMVIPRNCIQVLQKLFERTKYRGEITVSMAQRIRATSGSPVYQLGQLTSKNTLELKVKTDGNGSRHMFHVSPPDGSDLATLSRELKGAIESIYPTREERTVATPLKVPMSDILRSSKLRQVPTQKQISVKAAPDEKQPTMSNKKKKRIVDLILADKEIVVTLMEIVSEKVVDGEIDRKLLLSIIGSQKLTWQGTECKPTHIFNYLRRRGLLEVQDEKRGITKVNYTPTHKVITPAAPDPSPVKKIEISVEALETGVIKTLQDKEPTTMKPTDETEEPFLAVLRTKAEKYTNIMRSAEDIDKKMEILQKSMDDLKEEKEIVLAGAAKHKEAHDMYTEIKNKIQEAKEILKQAA